MASQTTLTSKGQMTVPRAIRRRLGLARGTKLSVRIVGRGFVVEPRETPLILKDRGILAPYDDGRPLAEIRKEAQRRAAEEIVKRAHRK